MASAAETGSLIFAVTNVVLSSFSTVLGFTIIIFHHWRCGYLPELYLGMTSVVAFGIVMSIMSLAFTSLLIKGILKKNSKYVKLYVVFGFVKMALCLLVFLSFTLYYEPPYPYFVPWIVLLVNVIYCLILFMIRYTYVLYETKSDQFDHKPLISLVI